MYINAALAYAKLNMNDSARSYLQMVKKENNHYNSMMIALAKSTIYKSEGDFNNAFEENLKYNAFADSVEKDSIRNSAFVTELNIANNDMLILKQDKSIKEKIIYYIIASTFIFIVLIGLFTYRKRVQNKRIINSLKGEKLNLHFDLTALIEEKASYYNALIENHQLTSQMSLDMKEKEKECIALRNLVSSHVRLMESLITASEEESDKVFQKTFKQLTSDYHNDKSIMMSFISFANQNFNGVVEKCLIKAPNLSLMDQYVIALMAAGFEYKEIAVITKYAISYIGKKRSRIEMKLGIEEKLIDYINKIKKDIF